MKKATPIHLGISSVIKQDLEQISLRIV